MFCRECGADLYDRRSDLCLACSAVSTLNLEFRETWATPRLRSIATEITLGAARSVRALRIFGRSFSEDRPTELRKSPLVSRTSGGERREDRPKSPLGPIEERSVTPEPEVRWQGEAVERRRTAGFHQRGRKLFIRRKRGRPLDPEVLGERDLLRNQF